MAKTVFISHASADLPTVENVVNGLTVAGIEVLFDRQELRLGDSFLTFMENGMAVADYCLLLWSRSAAATEWVRLEWEAALYRSISEKRSFLMTGRLEDVSLPALVAPRLCVDLFPNLRPGLDQIVESWQADRHVEKQTCRQVANVTFPQSTASNCSTVYVTSEAFGVTVPLKTNLDEPVGMYLDRIVTSFNLPKMWDYQGRIGVRFGYRLMNGDEPLNRALSLKAQRVQEKTVLWLETTMTPYSGSEPLHGALQSTGFRGSDSEERGKPAPLAMEQARQAYIRAVLASGLGPT